MTGYEDGRYVSWSNSTNEQVPVPKAHTHMQASFELTEGLKGLRQIIASFPAESPHWNESQNRFHFIDRLLRECLGWVHPYINVEVSDDAGGKSDYILGRPSKAILEAKREAKLWEALPQGKPSIVRKLDPLLKASKNFEEVVHQILPYCTFHGAQMAIVCNGPQLAIFQALTPGFSPLQGECYFFNGFTSYVENFPLLWSLLSPEGVTENKAYRDLSLNRTPRIPEKASTAISEPHRFRYRSNFQESLRELSSLLLEEVEENPDLKSEFYKDCYVSLAANSQHLLLSKRVIAARYKRVGDDGIAPQSIMRGSGTDGDLRLASLLLEGVSARPYVVIGDVGVGKTSFFENLYESLGAAEKKQTYFIHLNLGIKANLSADVKSYVIIEIPGILKKKYGVDINDVEFVEFIYRDELRSFDRRVKGALKRVDPVEYEKERISFLSELTKSKDTHLVAALAHIARGQGKRIILVMDNADQRNFEIQQEAFLIAQELAATRNLLVFVALRPSTFYASKTTGALSGYQNRILTISPPPADEVIEKRLVFAVRVAEGKVAPAALSGIRLQLGNVALFLKAMLRSIKSNDSIKLFLSNITGGNTRESIELVTAFCGSPNVDSEKIVREEEKNGNYKVPIHEFTKHALLGEYAYYNSQSSLVACNIFDISSADPREHFLASLIIAYLGSNIGVRDNDGFVSGVKLIAEISQYGFIDTQGHHALRRLARKKLIETPHAHYRELPVPEGDSPQQFHFRATSVGVYHLRHWMGSFSFLDAMSIDTPVFDSVARAKIFDLSPSFAIADRLDKALCFKGYLEEQWHLANIGASYYDFPQLLKAQESSFLSVKQVIVRAESPHKSWSRG